MDRLLFDGRTVIVTGAGNGIGAEYAREFARRRASVLVNDIDRAGADRVVGEIRAAGGVALASYDPVADPEAAANLVASAIHEFGRVDGLINNAGWTPRNAAFEDLTIEELDGLLSVHLRGAVFVAQHAYRQMKKQRYGRIVNVSSSAGVYGIWGLSGYGSAKTAQLGMMNVIAVEGAEHGILANAILPGARSTHRAPRARPEDLAAQPAKLGPLASRSSAAFVAPMVVYLASEACTRTHCIYNAQMGWYSEVFIGVVPGWMSPSTEPPTAEDIVAHLDEIENRTGYVVPRDRTEYSDFMIEQSRELESLRPS